MRDVAGWHSPEIYGMADLVREYLRKSDRRRLMVLVRMPDKVGASSKAAFASGERRARTSS